jgi:hypothetical protein
LGEKKGLPKGVNQTDGMFQNINVSKLIDSDLSQNIRFGHVMMKVVKALKVLIIRDDS